MDYDIPRGAPAGGGELTDMERQALDLYVITPRALPGVMHMIDMMNKDGALTAFHEKGSAVEPFEDAIGGGPFGNQHGFICEDDCWVTTIEDEDYQKRGYLVIACLRFHTELRPLLDLYLWLAGKTFEWCDGEASVAGATPDMTITFGEDGALATSNDSEPSTWEISGASTAVIHCFAQAHAPACLPMYAGEHPFLTHMPVTCRRTSSPFRASASSSNRASLSYRTRATPPRTMPCCIVAT